MNKKYKRVETGSLQFGDDWPCVVIRGDNAAYFAFVLKEFLDSPEKMKNNVIMSSVLNGLVSTLGGCIVTADGGPNNCQYVKDFNEVVIDKPK